jgi:DNA-binding winged helix-turn-helix (wHTH) protein
LETVKSSKNGANGSSYRYVFDGFEVDPSNRTCTQYGEPVPISGKVYDILLAFIENPGRLLSKEELLERIWADEFVEEGNLARNVSTLRKALGDTEKQHRYIATVPGHGYRFVADVDHLVHDLEKVELGNTPVRHDLIFFQLELFSPFVRRRHLRFCQFGYLPFL